MIWKMVLPCCSHLWKVGKELLAQLVTGAYPPAGAAVKSFHPAAALVAHKGLLVIAAVGRHVMHYSHFLMAI